MRCLRLCPAGRKSIVPPSEAPPSELHKNGVCLRLPKEGRILHPDRASHRFNCLAFWLPHGVAVVTWPCIGRSRVEAGRCLPCLSVRVIPPSWGDAHPPGCTSSCRASCTRAYSGPGYLRLDWFQVHCPWGPPFLTGVLTTGQPCPLKNPQTQ